MLEHGWPSRATESKATVKTEVVTKGNIIFLLLKAARLDVQGPGIWPPLHYLVSDNLNLNLQKNCLFSHPFFAGQNNSRHLVVSR